MVISLFSLRGEKGRERGGGGGGLSLVTISTFFSDHSSGLIQPAAENGTG